MKAESGITKGITKVLIDEQLIKSRVAKLAEDILQQCDLENLMVISLMKGAIVFTADLFRMLPVELELELMNVSSYHGGTESSGEIKFLDQNFPDVKGKNILLVDDIFDTGLTLRSVSTILEKEGAKTVKSCVLLSKNKQREGDYTPDFIGFNIEDEFVVGYGLDYQGKYRNLPYVGVLSL